MRVPGTCRGYVTHGTFGSGADQDRPQCGVMRRVEVWRGGSDLTSALFGPLPGMHHDDVVAYEFEPWPGSSRLERTYVLLDLGVSMSVPVGREAVDPHSWHVNLVSIERDGRHYAVRDLFLDVIVPVDGRHHRMLDLDEFAGQRVEDGSLTVSEAIDALRRLQAFLDVHLHGDRDPSSRWTDFPPRAIEPLAALPAPLGPRGAVAAAPSATVADRPVSDRPVRRPA